MDCKTVLTFASASELRRGLEADRVMPRPVSGTLLWSWLEPVSPAEPRVTELPAFLSDVLQEPGASVVGGLFRSCSGTGNPQILNTFIAVSGCVMINLLYLLYLALSRTQ